MLRETDSAGDRSYPKTGARSVAEGNLSDLEKAERMVRGITFHDYSRCPSFSYLLWTQQCLLAATEHS